MKATHMALLVTGIVGIIAIAVGTTVYLMRSSSNDDDGMAQIIAIKPHMISNTESHQKCHHVSKVVYVNQQSEMPAAGAVIGGVAGGVLGNSAFHGSGKGVATIVGAVGGAVAGNEIQESMNKPVPKEISHTKCVEVPTTTQTQEGYEVTYIYQGTQGVRILPSQPIGTKIPVSTLETAPSVD
jgi:uncharacterized protein YcfJ